MLFLLMTQVLRSHVVLADTCTSKDLIKKSCDFFERNSDKAVLRTSTGASFENPLASKKEKLQGSSRIERGETPIYERPARGNGSTLVDSVEIALEMEAEVEDLFKSTKIAVLPTKSRRALMRPDFLRSLLFWKFPKIEIENFPTAEIFVPDQLHSASSTLRPANDGDFQAVANLIGDTGLSKLREIFLKNESRRVGAPPAKIEEFEARDSRLIKTTGTKSDAENEKRIRTLFNYSRNQLVLLIKNGRSDSQLTQSQKQAIKKVETIQFRPVSSLDPGTAIECATDGLGGRSAFYQADLHSFSICPGLYDLPSSQLVLAIGHEMGHAIDPCRSGNQLLKVDLEAVNRVLEEKFNSEDLSAEDDEARHFLKDLVRRDVQYLNSTSKSDLEAPRGRLAKAKEAFRVVSEGIASSEHPFEKVRSCLVSQKGIEEVTSVDVEEVIRVHQSMLRRSNQQVNKADIEERRKELMEARLCWGTPTKGTEHNEAMCDFYGAFVQSRYLSENPPKTEEDLYGSFSFFTSKACSHDPIVTLLKQEPLDGLRMSHPSSARRLQNIIFEMPGLSQHFGCLLKSPSNCFRGQEFLLRSKPMEASKSSKSSRGNK